jgi:hypothetical protein
MGFSYRKRINVGKGLGVTLTSAGMSASYRTQMGSVGSKGYSIRTGIPGLTFRSSWARGKYGLLVLLIIAIVTVIYVVVYNVIGVCWFGVVWIYRRITKQNVEPKIL